MRAPLRVWLRGPLAPAFEAALRRALAPTVVLVASPTRPDPPDYQVLVGGRPSAEDLDRPPRLATVVIPFAGLPPATRTLLLDRPHLACFNLHHNAPATAELAIGLLLAAARRIVPFDRSLRRGDWRPRYGPDRGVLLEGEPGVVVGWGAIGRRVGRALAGLGMRVVGVRRDPRATEAGSDPPVVGVDRLDAVLEGARAVVLALPLTDETRGLIDRRRLALPGPGAVLVNVSRAEIVVEESLYEALAEGTLGAAGLDVWWRYPADEAARANTPPSAHPFHTLDNAVLSPHRGGLADRTERRRGVELGALLNRLGQGDIPRRVDPAMGY